MKVRNINRRYIQNLPAASSKATSLYELPSNPPMMLIYHFGNLKNRKEQSPNIPAVDHEVCNNTVYYCLQQNVWDLERDKFIRL